MPIKINEQGKIYNNFLVLERDKTKTNRAYWICECQKCKTQKSISGTDLRKNKAVCLICKEKDEKTKEIGNIYGKLKVIDFAYRKEDRHYVWKCQCECGNIENVLITTLRSGKKTQCLNCYKKQNRQYIDEIGKKYGKLTVLEYDKEKSKKQAYWKCKCECGNVLSILGTKLRKGQTSCGCLKSKGEYKINELLSENSINYKTQVKFNDCKDINLLPFDFGVYDDNDNLLYLIEFDGIQHYTSNNRWFNTKEDFDKIKQHDLIKTNYCKKNNINLIRIPYWKYEKLTIKDLII